MLQNLKKPWVLVLGYTLSVLFNLPHMVEAYDLLGVTDIHFIYKWLMMLVIDFGILILAVNGDDEAAYFFAVLVFFLNLFAHWVRIDLVWGWGLISSHTPGLLYAIIPAAFVWYFSKQISDRIEIEQERIDIGNLRKDLGTLRSQANSDRLTIDKLSTDLEKAQEQSKIDRTIIDNLSTELETVRAKSDKDRQALEKLRPVFESVRALNGAKISVGGVKACKCPKCMALNVAPSNKATPDCFNCESVLPWK